MRNVIYRKPPRVFFDLFFNQWARPILFAFSALTLLLFLNNSARAQAERSTVRVDGRAVFRVGAVGEQTAGGRARVRFSRRDATISICEKIHASRFAPPHRAKHKKRDGNISLAVPFFAIEI